MNMQLLALVRRIGPFYSSNGGSNGLVVRGVRNILALERELAMHLAI